MRLDSDNARNLRAVMTQSFTPQSLEILLIDHLDVRIHDLTSQLKPFTNQVLDICSHFQSHNTTEILVAALRDARPSDKDVGRIARLMAHVDGPSDQSLEVLISTGVSSFTDVEELRLKMGRIEDAVCRVETSSGRGTGLMIGKNLVITNHHVVSGLIELNGDLKENVICRFDYKGNGPANGLASATVAAREVIVSSPPSSEDSDQKALGNDVLCLDFAVLKLDRNFADDPIVPAGESRGFVSVHGATGALNINDPLFVFQHPQGQPMKVALGVVSAVSPARFRHNANTLPGSSGAPVFNARLEFVGIHHAGYEGMGGQGAINQAIPVGPIMKYAEDNGVGL